MRLRVRVKLVATGMTLMFVTLAAAGANRSWHEGTLLSAQRQEQNATVASKDTKTDTDKSGARHTTSTTTTQNINTAVYMIYTITDGTRTYEARQGTTIWQTKLKAQPGDRLKFAVDGNTLYVQREDGKESKMKVMKVSVTTAGASPQQ